MNFVSEKIVESSIPISKIENIEVLTNDLLEEFKHYLSQDLFSGYNDGFDDDINKFKIHNLKKFKDKYRSISDEKIIKSLVKWIKYLPYEGHNKIMRDLLLSTYYRHGDHIRKIIDCNYVYSILNDPLKRILWFIFEEWVNEVVEKTYYDTLRFNSIMYDTLKFINDNKKSNLFRF